jgi:hypothetical protein
MAVVSVVSVADGRRGPSLGGVDAHGLVQPGQLEDLLVVLDSP